MKHKVVAPANARYRCGFPGCSKRYVSTDGVRKLDFSSPTSQGSLEEEDEEDALQQSFYDHGRREIKGGQRKRQSVGEKVVKGGVIDVLGIGLDDAVDGDSTRSPSGSSSSSCEALRQAFW